MELEVKTEKLLGSLKSLGSAVIGYSGGVDSAVLCLAAFRALGSDRMLACLADSPSLPGREKRLALETAMQAGFPVKIYSGTEMENSEYVKNAADRCYHCKGDLFLHLRRIALEKGFAHCLYGANADDGGDFRPGHRAARENGAHAPLAEAGLNKEEIRALAKAWGLSCHDKPSSPCLSSRIVYGQPVTESALRRIEIAESLLREAGFTDCRVRADALAARIEVPVSELHRLGDGGLSSRLTAEFHRLGFIQVAFDPRGIRSGNLNEGLGREERRSALTGRLTALSGIPAP